MKLTILGNAAGGSYQGRHYSSQFLEYGKYRFLIDCGEGTQMQLFDLGVKNYATLDAIFISHLHGDHVFGLIGLLNSFSMMGRRKKLELFAPAGVEALIEVHQKVCDSYIAFPLQIHEIDTNTHQLIYELKELEVWSIPLKHRVPASGYFFKEKVKPLNIIASKIAEYGMDYTTIRAVKGGADLELPSGQRIPNAELTRDPKPVVSYAYCSDTMPLDSVAAQVGGATILYHEATLTNEFQKAAVVGMHSTAEEAATIAQKAAVKKLLLGHISIRFKDFDTILSEARAVFSETYIAEEGLTIEF